MTMQSASVVKLSEVFSCAGTNSGPSEGSEAPSNTADEDDMAEEVESAKVESSLKDIFNSRFNLNDGDNNSLRNQVDVCRTGVDMAWPSTVL